MQRAGIPFAKGVMVTLSVGFAAIVYAIVHATDRMNEMYESSVRPRPAPATGDVKQGMLINGAAYTWRMPGGGHRSQNGIIEIFSVAAVVLMPPTLIASIYGMNFKNILQLEWPYGYSMALVLMVIAAVFPYLVFKWKK